MDKTVIDVETIDLIGNKILNNNKIAELTKKAMSGVLIIKTQLLRGLKS